MQPGDEFYVQAFDDLKTERSSGMGMGNIPWSSIVRYADRAGLDESNTDMFVAVIKEMDSAYLRWYEQESERGRRNSKRDGKRAERRVSRRGKGS